MASNQTYGPVTPNTYKINILAGASFNFVSCHTIFPYNVATDAFTAAAATDTYTQEIYLNDETTPIFTNTYSIRRVQNSISYTGEDIGATLIVQANTVYKIVYTYTCNAVLSSQDFTNSVQYLLTSVENYLPLKKWTITDVINRLLSLAKPIRQGETPLFVLNSTQAALFDNILAPQFSFTKQTLRECLQEIGGAIHGEPRLNIQQDSSGNYYYEISYDMYGGATLNGIATRPYLTQTVSQAIEGYCTSIDTSAENLVNALSASVSSFISGKNGVITEPYAGGFKTPRCDVLYNRISEDNMLIATQVPIYDIQKIECGIIPNNTSLGDLWDITSYVFESSQYNSRLSAYDSGYPYSKAYGIMFTQGQRNITALNFKQENPISSVFANYAIINILREVTGNQNLSVTNYPLLAFRITYTPIYGARVSQTKPYYKDLQTPSALIYNQQSNVIEARYYGEHLKGVTARLGNVELTKTYRLSRLSQIPQAGQKYDENYYISAVSVEMFSNLITCTIGLSKDFNRLSQYIGISSVKRYSEVSETQAQERNALYREYIVIGDEETPDTDSIIGDNFMQAVATTFTQSQAINPLTCVVTWGETGQGNTLPSVILPVIGSAFGNSLSFTWAYEDNYSAGAISQYQSSGSVSGYFQNNYQYTDYYGRIYYYNFDLQTAGPQPTDFNSQSTLGCELPGYDGTVSTSSGYLSTVGLEPYVLRKDNREILKVNAQVDFVTNINSLIIGSALAYNNPLIAGTNNLQGAKLYVFTQPLDKFINHVTGSIDVNFTDVAAGDYTLQLLDLPSAQLAVSAVSGGQFTVGVQGGTFPGDSGVQYQSWAIVTPQLTQSEQVEDDTGETSTQSVQYGGDVLIAQNINFSAGDTFPPIYFTKKREIFNAAAWIAPQ